MTLPSSLGASSVHPYEQLTPDVVLDALACVGLYGDGRLTALGSYENRVYQAHLEDGERVVAKFYRPGRWSRAQLEEEHGFAAELAAAEIPAVAPLVLQGATLHEHAGFTFSVSPWRGGRQPELDDFEVLEWIGRYLARIHTVGAARPFVTRPPLDLQCFGHDCFDWLLAGQIIPLEAQSAWRTACEQALALIGGRASSKGEPALFGLEDADSIRLHGDCHPGNILWTPVDEDRGTGGPHFVDLDDARMGPAVQDLWMLLSGDRRQRTQQLGALLDGYEQFRPFDRRELVLIEPLRTLRLIHYSAWLARRWEDPIFAINFPWFGSPDYWRGQTDMLHEQIEAMQEAPLSA
ncbi:serine/threonine protein kinase [Comamonas endophytica]|uniref:Stress response kinase A n=1 Tax=Comamonas endophytica TaxID=2949090 RepID=A0ABY6G5Z8_9BURK|nr:MULTISPECIES: serine/threonine protein kinase [unclassified Acidovorax]MCD2511028.1 serine/threonine protein kinase [Acidovorax sp. D4N7]UYG50435.1 serine/threonine protein kinase [Acidovorax sp. 5MLIR]